MASVCQSLQCLISALTQAGGGGLLFRRLVPSRSGEGLALLFPSTLLRLLAALYGACPALRGVPALGCSTKPWIQLRLRFVPSLAQAAQAARSLTGALSPGAARLLPSAVPASVSASARRVRAPSPLQVPSSSPRLCRSGVCALCLAATLPVDVNHPVPGSSPGRIQGNPQDEWRR